MDGPVAEPECQPAAAPCADPAWQVLVVDGDPGVHGVVQDTLEGVELLGRPLGCLHAYTRSQARAMLLGASGIAVVLLGATEDGDAGDAEMLDFIRHTAGLGNTRIVLCTAQAGHAPDEDTLLRYDINDFRAKSEWAQGRLLPVVLSAIRSYEQRCSIDASRRSLELIVRSSAALLEEPDLQAFATGVLTQLGALLDGGARGMACMLHGAAADSCRVVAATGRFAGCIGRDIDALPDVRCRQLLARALKFSHNVHGEEGGIALYFGNRSERGMAVFVDTPHPHNALDRQLLDVFSINMRTLLLNRDLLDRLRRFAYYDPLVRLPNRAHFVEKVDDCVRRGGAQDHVLALIDIDDFSAANDVMGHAFGYRLLEAVARRLADALPSGVLLARVGSDTFGVLGEARQVALPQLLQCVRPPPVVDGVPQKVSLTCGYVHLPSDAQKGADLVKDATIALKRAKRDHRGQHLQYLEHMGREARDRAMLLSDLRAAIDDARLFLVYQPQLHLGTGALVGMEALLRWRLPDGRFVSPDDFIPIAEHSGLIAPLGQWVLSTACQTLCALAREGLTPPRISVNVSVVQLQDPAFPDAVRAALAASGLRGSQLELEITESVAVVPTQLLQSTLASLRADGVSIAIDDFGTGYSSLSYLERLPLDRIKIDRSFVRRPTGAQGARIAEMILRLGHQLGLRVMAEGIEDAATWDALLRMGCDEGQGYHIAVPMDLQQLRAWLAARPAAQRQFGRSGGR
ncbi:EAL domain-containing protein [Paracidovorax citrulli]|nr:EAL domain-containing protein [Paracidovorax citrulli]UMT90671.1 EAL domain-containing protein [Paracidovorax citrulli]WIY36958.1 EAL domain-containing protein [Paracidovorax citrulli]